MYNINICIEYEIDKIINKKLRITSKNLDNIYFFIL